MTSEPVIKKNSTIPVIWSLPIIALCICAWLIYSSYKNAGVEITISFDDASGIIPGKTQVMARGIPVGLVKKIIPDLENKQIKTIVKIEQAVADYLVEDAQFWVVRPELSASSVQGLDTIFSGSYISFQAGTSTSYSDEFKGLSSAPPVSRETPGLHLQLRAEALGSIQVGTGIYYRNIEIGKVQRHQLERDESILIDIFIEPDFAHLVKEASRFCNASGMRISGKLSNLKVQIESLASLLRGGVLLHTPEQLQDSPNAGNGHIFTLYPDYESANYGIPMTLTMASGADIIEGTTKVMYSGLEAGFVKEIQINTTGQKTVTAHILLDPRAEIILKENTRFWMVKTQISPSGIENLGLLLSGPYITFEPGSGAFQNHFEILPEPPPQTPLRAGKTFVLISEEPINISPKAPVYFKNINVGEVIDVDFEKSTGKIRTTLFIYEEYLHLLSTNSVFWTNSGVEIAATIDQGLKISTSPLAAIIQGGVSFTTPDKLKREKNVVPEEGYEYRVYSSYKQAIAAIPALQPSGKHILIKSKDAKSLSVGAPILHKNLTIGEIKGFHLSSDQQSVLIDCFIFDKFKHLVHGKTKFYNTSGFELSAGLEGLNLQTGSLHSIFTGGIGCINIPSATRLPPETPYTLYENLQAALLADEIELTVYLDSSKGLKVGSPVKHKGIKVGRVSNLFFADDLQTIICSVHINKNIEPLFRTGTLIWVEQAEINLSGVDNIETVIFGSYLHFLPGDGPLDRTFSALAAPPRTKIANRDGLGLVLEAKHSGSLSGGSPVYYRQIQVGQVTGFELSPTFQKVLIFVSIGEEYKSVIRENTRFWNVSGAKIKGGLFSGLSVSTESFTAMLRGGIALATPNNEDTGPVVPAGHHFTLHKKPKDEWLDWSPDIILLKKEQSQRSNLEQ